MMNTDVNFPNPKKFGETHNLCLIEKVEDLEAF